APVAMPPENCLRPLENGVVAARMPAENSDVLPVGSVAVAVRIWLGPTGRLSATLKLTLPPASVITLTNGCPDAGNGKRWPSGGRLSGSGSLAKNSMRYCVLGSALRVPVMRVLPVPSWKKDVSTGAFWKLLGSLAAPWPWESLGVGPSSLGKVNWLVRS